MSWETEYAQGHLVPGAPFTPFVPQEPYEYGPIYMPGRLNVRVPVQKSVHAAPDASQMGGAYGEIRSRPANVQVATTLAPLEYQGELRFVYGEIGNVGGYNPAAWIPNGGMAPQIDRANIDVPAHVAYGSLFTSQTPTYGYA